MIHQKIKIKLSLTFLLLIQVLSAQVTTFVIPAGNADIGSITPSEWRKPFGTYDGYERTAFIFWHSEIGQFCQINSLGFFCDTSIHNPGKAPVKIYMKETPNLQFPSPSTVANEELGAQLVYADTIYPSAFVVNQLITINLTTPFIHASSNSIEIIIETNAGGTGNEVNIYGNNPGLSKSFYHNYPNGYYLSQYWGSDNTPPAGVGYKDGYRINVEFGIIPLTNCTSTPVAGTTLSSVDTTCSQVLLSLQNSTAAVGITYQWQDSTSGGAWVSLPYANYATLIANITQNTWYRCLVSCGALTSYSSVKGVMYRNYMQCYCFSDLGGGCSTDSLFGSAIDSVGIAGTTLANGLSGCAPNNYTLYPAFGNTCAQLASGQSYDLHTKYIGNVIASVWIDYNQSGSFDSTEWSQICLTSYRSDSDIVTILNVPSNAKTGLTLMRIRARASGNSNDSTDACTNFASGETEDYYVGINYPVGISSQLKTDNTILIYPNPTADLLNVSGNFITNQSVNLSLYSLSGALVSQTETKYNGKSFTIDVSSFETGIYFLKLSGKDFSIVKKVVINH